MKLVKLLVSLACCLLFSTPLWAASLTPIDEATPNPSGLYALSHLAASGAVTELTDKELARIEGGDVCTHFCIPNFTVHDLIITAASDVAVSKGVFRDVNNILDLKPAPHR
jgi:bacteriocin-like protein